MGLRLIYKYVDSYSAEIDFSRQNLTSYRRQILTTKIDPRTVRVKAGEDWAA